jgi:predicted DNA binding CopG/RHH family protein
MKQMKNKDENKSRIPDFTSYEEEAKWWESHNLADYQDEFKNVKVKFGKNLSAGLNIRLDPTTLTKLRAEASKKGIGPTTLVRILIMDHFQQQI